MQVTVREYTPEDEKVLLSLIESLHGYLVGLDPIKRIRMMSGFGENKIKRLQIAYVENEGKCFLAESDGKAIGYVCGLIAKQSEENLLSVIPTRLGVINDLFVLESFRNHRVGEKLIESIETYFKDKGCTDIWLEVFEPNIQAHAFYKRHGYNDREISMMKKI